MDLADWQLDQGVTPSEQVTYGRRGRLGLVVLDRPKAINSLTLDMVTSVRAQLEAWAADDSVGAVAVTGAGDRGLCAGGDVVAVRRGVLEGGDAAEEALRFFAVEYEMNRAIAHFPKPYVALIEGVTMGGGVGISGHGSVRLADPGATIAMPETIIGFFCDVGARRVLARCPGETGAYLAMTGASIDGPDAVRLGFADALVDATDFPAVLARFADGEAPVAADLGDPAPAARLADDHAWVDECFAGDDPVAILDRLQAHPDERAREAASAIAARSPMAVALALELVRRAQRDDDIDAILDADHAIARAVPYEQDFLEGVRAQLVDKDRRPIWQHKHLRDVAPAYVEALAEGRRPGHE